MDLHTFEQRAFELWEAIPAHFRQGVSTFAIEPGTFTKPEFEDGWCYGTCEADEAVMLIPEAPVTSIITVYYGSFVQIAASTPDFDWDAELWETIRHELQHHLEWRGGVDHLGDDDDVQDDNERRVTGQAFTPDFHRWGTQLDRHVWLADGDLFLERVIRDSDWTEQTRQALVVRWAGLEATAPPVPDDLRDEDLLYVDASFSEQGDSAVPFREVVIVLRRKRSWWQVLLGR